MHTDKILNTAYSFAAAIVVFGAWAKLEQKEFGSLALTIGLLVESGIFLIYGLMEWRSRPGTTQLPERPETPLPKMPAPPPFDNSQELARTIEHTNLILKRIFRAE